MQHRDQRVVVLADRRQRRRVAGLEQRSVLAQVLADAEGPAGPGEHQRPDGDVVADGGDRVEQGRLGLEGQGVHALWAVERDRGDGAGALEQDEVGHGRSLPLGVRRGWHAAPAAPPGAA